MNSLNQRLSALEAQSNVPNNTLLNKIKQLEQEKKEKQLLELTQSYLSYLNMTDSDQIVEIIYKTMKYTKENLTNISKVLSVRASPDLEEEIVIYFISVHQMPYQDAFIRETFKFLNKLPIKEPEPEPETLSLAVVPKKSFIRNLLKK